MKVGDWVYYVGNNENLIGAAGYLQRVGERSAMVHFVTSIEGERIDIQFVAQYDRLLGAEGEPKRIEWEFGTLMDLALRTKDWEWCEKLVNEYRKGARL